jgi:hypothetical protein
VIVGRVFDTSAIVDFGIRRTRYAETVVWSSTDVGTVIVVPMPAYVAALAQIPPKDHDVAAVLLTLPVTVRIDLTPDVATGVADTLRPVGASSPQGLTAASVVHAARSRGWRILTGDPLPILALWGDAEIEPLP